MPSLFEEYRPATWEELIGQDKAVAVLRRVCDARGWGGRALWVTGEPGTGKTSLAYLAAREIADDWSIEEWDAGKLAVSDLDALERAWSLRGMGKGGRAYIINEAHGLRKPVIRQLLVMLERIPEHVLVVFTTTVQGNASLFEDYDDAKPLLSRCFPVDLSRRGLCEPFAKRLVAIARQAGLLNGHPDEWYVPFAEKILKEERNDFRQSLYRAERGELLTMGEK
jgi:replication-associated recombination protein RarA